MLKIGLSRVVPIVTDNASTPTPASFSQRLAAVDVASGATWLGVSPENAGRIIKESGMRVHYCLIAVLLAVGLQPAASAQTGDRLLGVEVWWKDSAVAKVGDQVVDKYKVLLFPAKVGAVQGDWLWLGRAWVRRSDVMELDEAFDYYVEQVRRNPGSARAWRQRASCWQRRGELANAIKDLDEAIRLDPKYAYAYNNLAFLRATCPEESIRDGAAALRLAEQGLEIDPRSGYGWSAKACALAAQGQFDQAAEAQQRALEDSDYAEDEDSDGGKHAKARLAQWAAGQLWTSDMVNQPAPTE